MLNFDTIYFPKAKFEKALLTNLTINKLTKRTKHFKNQLTVKSFLQRQLVSLQTTIENTIAQSIKRFSWNLTIMCQQAVTHELILSLLKLCLLQGLRHQDWFRLIPRREISQMCLIQNKMRQITQINWSL